MQAFERYMREHGLDTLDGLYTAPTLSDTLYRHVALGSHLSDDLADGDHLEALMVRLGLVCLLMQEVGEPPLHGLSMRHAGVVFTRACRTGSSLCLR